MFNYLRQKIDEIRYSINVRLDMPFTVRELKYLLNIVGILVTTSLMMFVPQEKLINFFNIWPLEQWVSSLVGLVLLYYFATYLYNQRLIKYDLKMVFTVRFWMIFSDLLINLGVGLYYLEYRDTMMGMLMVKCPIAISPFIFVIEFLVVILINEYEIYKQNRKRAKKK